MAATISGASGSFTQGGTITISGSSFGSGGAPLLWDDMEGGTNGAGIPASPMVGAWNRNDPTNTTFDNAQKHSGALSQKGAHAVGSAWQHFNITLPDLTYLYASFWFRYNVPAEAGQPKIMQIHGTYGVGDYNPGVMSGGFAHPWWATYIALENTGTANQVNYPNFTGADLSYGGGDYPPTQNAWHHYEVIAKQSTVNVADGSVLLKINGDSIYTQNNVKTRERAGERWNLIEMFAGCTNFTSTAYTWLDDVYVCDSWARVEIGDNATYASCTHREVMPATSWSTSSITATFNAGSFANGTAYLFVIDSTGAASSGYAITVGGSGSLLAAPAHVRWRPH